MEELKKLLVITAGSYPYGEAATNRHLAYLKGLVEVGVNVKILILQQDKNQSTKSKDDSGVFDGIEFQYVKSLNSPTFKSFLKILDRIRTLRKSIKLIKNELINSKDISVLFLNTEVFEIIPMLNIVKRKRIKTFHERTEFPFLGANTSIKKIKLKLYLNQLRKFDGLFVITNALVEYFQDFINKEKIHHIPMIVDPERFSLNQQKKSSFGNYIAYCGSMYTDKDGVPILIEAFDAFADEFPEINLVLIGDNSDSLKFKIVQDKISMAKNKNRIYLTGFINRDELPTILYNAKALALARPDNIQAKGGFPTKLGEYLATGLPVVVTSVGEIPNYLYNGENAFVSIPDNAKAFAEKLLNVFSDYKKATEIGLEGKKLAFTVFNYKVQSKRLYEFLYNTNS